MLKMLKILLALSFCLYFLKNYFLQTKLNNYIQPMGYIYNIPKIVFRGTKDLNVSKNREFYCHKKWIDLNPDFTFLWYTNQDQETFIKRNFPPRILKAYNKLLPGAYKADLWRLCVLYYFGGVYIDEYASPHVPFKKIIKNTGFISVMDCPEAGSGIHNGFIIAEKNHPFLACGIEEIVNNIENNYYGKGPLDPTGPMALKKAILKFLGNSNIKIGLNNGKYPFYLFHLKWGPYQTIYDGKNPIINKKYSILDYIYQKIFASNNYHKMWHNKNIYKKESTTKNKDESNNSTFSKLQHN